MQNQENQTQTRVPAPVLSQDQMLAEIYENTRKTKNYIKWQMYITIALVVIPLLAMAAMVPMLMNSLGTLGGVYGGVLQ